MLLDTSGLDLCEFEAKIASLVADRGWSLTAEQRARIDGEHDTERLRRWLRLAALAHDVADVFADGE